MKNGLYFLKLLKWYINDEKGQPEEGIDWDEILRLSITHSVQAMVFMAVDKFDEKVPVYEELKKNFLMAVNVAVLQDIGMEEVIAVLNEAEIKYIPIKGYVLREYYPEREARSFGDIDFFIKEEDREKCHKALFEVGFILDEANFTREIWPYKKGVLSIEVHTDIMRHKLYNDFDYIGYCRKMCNFENRVSGKLYTYKLKDEDHFIYLMIHLAKHFYNAGAGVRMVLDFAAVINKTGDSLDFEYIRSELEKIHLTEFSNIVFSICSKYFDTKIEYTDIDEKKEEAVLKYILGHGVFGHDDKNVIKIIYNRDGKHGVKLFINRIFPSYEEMTAHYRWFVGCKRYMLPYGWVRRLFFQLFNKEKRNSIGYRLSAAVGDNKDVETHLKMLELVGLKK
ncbi:MAG: nucleotidyltransferase family protein [Clostridiales bacterium]|nr:nucleotidyltransferase family protein [Clostridiales bacterium]